MLLFHESGCLGVQPKMGGKFHLKLNIGGRPIANKYCEGKMQRTLKRELKVLEIVKREAIGTSDMFVVDISQLECGCKWVDERPLCSPVFASVLISWDALWSFERVSIS